MSIKINLASENMNYVSFGMIPSNTFYKDNRNHDTGVQYKFDNDNAVFIHSGVTWKPSVDKNYASTRHFIILDAELVLKPQL